jgi:catechol 2,3-dioxygenase-like lactoylglutathione lyase family enzyme
MITHVKQSPHHEGRHPAAAKRGVHGDVCGNCGQPDVTDQKAEYPAEPQQSEPVHDQHPDTPRWTHLALRVSDLDATIDWYQAYTPLTLIDRREDAAGLGAWLGMDGETNNPFLLVLSQFFEDHDPYAGTPAATLTPFAHLGIEVPTRAEVDNIAARAETAGCLELAPTQLAPPIGYITMVRDPDGNLVEFSWDQGVYATLHQRWAAER